MEFELERRPRKLRISPLDLGFQPKKLLQVLQKLHDFGAIGCRIGVATLVESNE